MFWIEFFDSNESKQDRMLRYLRARKNKWVNGWDMVQYVKTLHHTQLIMNLRKKHNIENKTEWVKGQKHTYYRIIEE